MTWCLWWFSDRYWSFVQCLRRGLARVCLYTYSILYVYRKCYKYCKWCILFSRIGEPRAARAGHRARPRLPEDEEPVHRRLWLHTAQRNEIAKPHTKTEEVGQDTRGQNEGPAQVSSTTARGLAAEVNTNTCIGLCRPSLTYAVVALTTNIRSIMGWFCNVQFVSSNPHLLSGDYRRTGLWIINTY